MNELRVSDLTESKELCQETNSAIVDSILKLSTTYIELSQEDMENCDLFIKEGVDEKMDHAEAAMEYSETQMNEMFDITAGALKDFSLVVASIHNNVARC